MRGAVARMTECFSGAGSTGGGLPKGRSPHATGCSGHAEFGTALLVGDESPRARPCELALPGDLAEIAEEFRGGRL